MADTGISAGWAEVAESWLGIPDGRHCHWCRHIKHDDGASFCANTASPFHDGDRIRSWDGGQCASRCGQFALDDWYRDDANISTSFKD